MNNDISTEYTYNNVEEIIRLIKKSQQGDKNAQEILVRNNIGLVSTIVKKFLNRGFEYEDLFQIGCIGLIKAIRNFNTDFNVRFSTYAVPMIMGEIKRFIRDDGLIKVSRNLKETAKKVKQVKEKLTKEFGRDVTISEIAQEMCITSEDVLMSLESMHTPEYLYEVIHQDDGSPVLLIDKISEDRDYGNDVVDKVALKDLVNSLEPKARQVIILRYFKDLTQSQISEILGISQVQVSRIEKKVLENLRKAMK
ncbi:MAG: sigF [Clostridiales bacterium]|jgi:RNA polymerase sporulation-specific sigma factor|nr:sigF [Clostridiales bacterium]